MPSDRPVTHNELRRYARGATAAFIGLVLAVGYVGYSNNKDNAESREAIVTSGKVVSVEGCNRDYNSNLAGLTNAKDQRAALKRYLDDGVITDAQYERQIAALDRFEALLKLPDCREVAATLTDDVSNVRYPPPYPKYPGYSGG